jgi:hypothetical protein
MRCVPQLSIGRTVVLAPFVVPQADHRHQAGLLLVREVLCRGDVLVHVIELPAFGVKLGEHVGGDHITELSPGFFE